MKLSSLKGCVTNEKIYFPVRHFNAVYDFDIIKKDMNMLCNLKTKILLRQIYIWV